MIEIIDFIFENMKFIASYEIINSSMNTTIVEFTMLDGEKIQKVF